MLNSLHSCRKSEYNPTYPDHPCFASYRHQQRVSMRPLSRDTRNPVLHYHFLQTAVSQRITERKALHEIHLGWNWLQRRVDLRTVWLHPPRIRRYPIPVHPFFHFSKMRMKKECRRYRSRHRVRLSMEQCPMICLYRTLGTTKNFAFLKHNYLIYPFLESIIYTWLGKSTMIVVTRMGETVEATIIMKATWSIFALLTV